ncbi:hypothetical protein [Marinicella meishanensis]|uniref:hypothetical protein n=1 Tax=Marinicella meishanensis TaxID=2873263 RepID=UPI001CBE2789|nr:hypothetical protein [Marinicella sp. NBU2979]
MISNISALGFFHTFVGIAAIFSVLILLWREQAISWQATLGKVYLLATVITAGTALLIFKHGSFNVAHGLAVLTILAVVAGWVVEKTAWFKSWTPYVMALCYSSTILFHALPTATEILTRFPADAPRVTSLEDPLLQQTFLLILLVFLGLLVLQLWWLKKRQ